MSHKLHKHIFWLALCLGFLAACNFPAPTEPLLPTEATGDDTLSTPSVIVSTPVLTTTPLSTSDCLLPMLGPNCPFDASSSSAEDASEVINLAGCSLLSNGKLVCTDEQDAQDDGANSAGADANMQAGNNSANGGGNNNANASIGGGTPSGVDAFQNDKSFCELILGGTWTGDPQNPCKQDLQATKDRCQKLGFQWVDDPKHAYCKVNASSQEEAARKMCQAVGGVYTPPSTNGGRPSCIVNKTPSTAPNTNASSSNSASAGVDAFQNDKSFCELILGGTWTGNPQDPCKQDTQAIKDRCQKLGFQWVDDPKHAYCKINASSQEEAAQKMCRAVGGMYIPPVNNGGRPACMVNKSTASNSSGNTPSGNNAFQDDKSYCEQIVGGTWTGDPQNPCRVDVQWTQDRCIKAGGQPDTNYPYCKFNTASAEDAAKAACRMAGGVYTPGTNGGKPSCIVDPSNSPSSSYTPDSTDDLFRENPDLCKKLGGVPQGGNQATCDIDPQRLKDACDKLGGQFVGGTYPDCKFKNAEKAERKLCDLAGGTYMGGPTVVGSKYKPACIVGGISGGSGGSDGNNGGSGGSTTTIDPCATNPDDPSCTNTVDSSLQVDCDADPSACGSMTLDEGSGGSSGSSNDDTATIDPCATNPDDPACNTVDLGGDTGDTINLGGGSDTTITVDCNLYPTDPSCNTVVGP